jgi:hypothetical protein
MKITSEQLASGFFPFHTPEDVEESPSNFFASDGTNLGELIDSGDYQLDNPFAQLLADVYKAIRAETDEDLVSETDSE